MGKPLLTDEVLERARRRKEEKGFGYYSPNPDHYNDYEDDDNFNEYDEYEDYEEDWDEEYQGYQEGQTIRIPVEQSIIKSRRIETVKREEFRSKLNKILFWIVILVIIFLFAVFKL